MSSVWAALRKDAGAHRCSARGLRLDDLRGLRPGAGHVTPYGAEAPAARGAGLRRSAQGLPGLSGRGCWRGSGGHPELSSGWA